MSALTQALHRAYARLFGYFWLECHLCDRWHGGHQWRDRDGKPSSVDYVGLVRDEETDMYHQVVSRRAICPSCTRAGLGDKR